MSGADEIWEKVLINGLVFTIPFFIFLMFCYSLIKGIHKTSKFNNECKEEIFKCKNDIHSFKCRGVEVIRPKGRREVEKKEEQEENEENTKYSMCCCFCGTDLCQSVYTFTVLFYLIFVGVTCVLFFAFPQSSFEWITGYRTGNIGLAVRPFSAFLLALTLVFLTYWFYVEAYLLKGRYVATGVNSTLHLADDYVFERHLFVDLVMLGGILGLAVLVVVLTYFAANEASNGIPVTIGTIVSLTVSSVILVYLILVKIFHSHQTELDMELDGVINKIKTNASEGGHYGENVIRKYK